MAEEKKSGLSGQFILGVVASLVATAIWPVLSSFVKVLDDERFLPLWGYLTILTVAIVGFAWILFLTTRNLRAEIADDAETFEKWEKAEKEWEEILQQRDDEHGKQLGNWARAEKGFKDRIAELEAELATERELVYDDGLYYRSKDSQRKQPFCRVCHDKDGELSTVVYFYTDLRNSTRMYSCSICGENALPERAASDDDGDDIPF